MEKSKNAGIGFFEKYLTLWVILCMAAGVLILVRIANNTKGWFKYE